jgi:hypothetical protein
VEKVLRIHDKLKKNKKKAYSMKRLTAGSVKKTTSRKAARKEVKVEMGQI